MKNMSILFPSVLVVLAGSMALADWTLEWRTLNGGGVMQSTRGGFELSGTVGQFDAGSGNGPTIGLAGGYWFEHAPGDCVLDGAVTLHDAAIFEGCAAGPDSSEVSSACACMDFDGDGDVDLRDAAELQSAFSAP